LLGAANVADFPGPTFTLKLVPSSEVTVCVGVSLFDTVTVLPAGTEIAVNLKFEIAMVPDALLFAAPLLPLLLHAESATASPTTATRTLIRRERDVCMGESTETVDLRFTGLHRTQPDDHGCATKH
jgi:hypothetical protein